MKNFCSIGCALAALVSISACSPKESPETAGLVAEIEALEDAIQKAKEEKKLLSDDIKDWEQDLEDAEDNAVAVDELNKELALWKSHNERVTAAAQEAESHLEVWRKFVRGRLVGRELGNVLLADNSVLQAVSVVSLDDEAAVLKHKGGEATVDYDDLPEEIRLKLFHEATMDATASQ